MNREKIEDELTDWKQGGEANRKKWDPGTQLSAIDRDSLRQGSATILTPETGFMEDIFFIDQSQQQGWFGG